MTRQSIALVVLALGAAAALGLYAFRGYLTAILPYPAGADVRDVRLPRGFRIEVFAGDVPGARSLALGPGGLVVVGTRGPGKVYALRDPDGDGRAEPAVTLAEGLDVPNGVAARDGALYVAELSRILRFDGLTMRPYWSSPPAVREVSGKCPGVSRVCARRRCDDVPVSRSLP